MMIQTLVLRAESSQRGYLLTGRPDYLSHYTPALSALRDAVSRADALVRDSPRQVETMGALRRHIDDKLKEMRKPPSRRTAPVTRTRRWR